MTSLKQHTFSVCDDSLNVKEYMILSSKNLLLTRQTTTSHTHLSLNCLVA